MIMILAIAFDEQGPRKILLQDYGVKEELNHLDGLYPHWLQHFSDKVRTLDHMNIRLTNTFSLVSHPQNVGYQIQLQLEEHR